MPMFPLGSVLFPGMPAALRVFEQRYLDLLAAVLEREPVEMGVVLIERGHEVGGGDHRFDTATVGRVVQMEPGEGVVGLVLVGVRRIEVEGWLPDDPYPRAKVRDVPPLEWDPSLEARKAEVEEQVRAELWAQQRTGGGVWSPDVGLSEDPVESLWQLAALAPVGALDQYALLRAASAEQLLEDVARLTSDATSLRSAWGPGAADA